MNDTKSKTDKKIESHNSNNAETNEANAMQEWIDYGKFLIKLAVFMVILRSFIISPFNIPSESMQPRLLIGDYILVSKWSYGYSKNSLPFSAPLIPGRIFASEPAAGDVVVFKAPLTNGEDYIKRVIGLPGDIIQMRGGILEINGESIKKEKIDDFVIPMSQGIIDSAALRTAQSGSKVYPCHRPEFERKNPNGGSDCVYPRFRETLPNGVSYEILDLIPLGALDYTEAFQVPEGKLFLMGDNRDRSADSRCPAEANNKVGCSPLAGRAIGLVPQENLVGKAMFTVFSTDGSANWILPWTWFTAARPERIGEGF